MKRLNFIVEVIKNSTAFKTEQVSYEVLENEHVIVRDTHSKSDTFHATELIGTLSDMFRTFLRIENNKIELIIF